MELETVGYIQAPGYRVPLWVNPNEAVDLELGQGTRFRLILVLGGAAVVKMGERVMPVSAPAVLCLSELDSPTMVQSRDWKAKGLYFHPCALNGDFSFENVRGPLESTAAQDREWLWAFLERKGTHEGLVSLGPTAFSQLTRLFALLEAELKSQPDSYWPCRARSYFLELLLLVDRVSMCQPNTLARDALVFDGQATEASPVVLFLHTHYAEKITLKRLCEEFHTNHTTLSRQFRDTTGQSIMAYLAQVRIRVASSILRETTLPIAEIVDRIGYNDLTHFGRTFRRLTGETPSEYRRKHYHGS